MDNGADIRAFARQAQLHDARELWAEHGWGLTGRQTGAILAVIVTVSLVLKLAGA